MKFLVNKTQGCNVITGMLFALLLSGTVQGYVSIKSFHKIEAPGGGVHAKLTVLGASSDIQCARMCGRNDTCTSFTYNKTNKLCEMSDEVTANPSKDTYVKIIGRKAFCPTDKEYKLWTFPDMNLCIRYSWTTVDQRSAQTQCEEDGGHLVLIENDSMRLHMVNITSTLKVPTSGRTYLDGKDIGEADIFIDWKGEEAWLSWAPGNTFGSSQDCLSTRLVDGFRHWDYTCSLRCDYFLCQIDV